MGFIVSIFSVKFYIDYQVYMTGAARGQSIQSLYKIILSPTSNLGK